MRVPCCGWAEQHHLLRREEEPAGGESVACHRVPVRIVGKRARSDEGDVLTTTTRCSESAASGSEQGIVVTHKPEFTTSADRLARDHERAVARARRF